MAYRKKPGEERSLCSLTFKIPLDVSFSVSAPPSVSDKFILEVANNNDDVSKVLRDFLFKELKISKRKDIDDLMEKPIRQARDIIYERMNANRRKNPFSQILLNHINKYLKKGEK